ncbi:MAG: hypothetical protein IPJ71_01205 [Bdellovibrionales bacterium]|nr:hypothetical protein [Bdellovibrionales bacterium]
MKMMGRIFTFVAGFLIFLFVFLCDAQALKVDVQSEGQIVICRDGNRESYRLLDYYEGEEFQSAFPKHEAWVFDKVRWALSQAESFHSDLIKTLYAALKEMPSQLKYISKGETTSPNEGLRSSGLPLNCRLEKALFRNSGENIKYSIESNLWQKLSADDQAGVIMNGLLTEFFQNKGIQVDQSKLRVLVRLWSQGAGRVRGVSYYVSSLRGLESLIPTVTLAGVDYSVDSNNSIRVYNNGQVESGLMASSENSYIYKSQNGFDIDLSGKRGPVKLSFHTTGVPRDALLKSETVEIPVQGKRLKFKYEVSFHPNGQIQRGFFLSEYGLQLHMKDGRIRRFKSMEYHLGIFDEAGRLVSARRLSNMNKLPEDFKGPNAALLKSQTKSARPQY